MVYLTTMILTSKIFDTITYVEGISSVCYYGEDYFIIIDNGICNKSPQLFDYDLYTEFQNRIVSLGKPVYRFLSTTESSYISHFITSKYDEISYEGISTYHRNRSHPDNTPIEHFFETQFFEAYGKKGMSCLQKEYPIISPNGRSLFLDYAVMYKDGSIVAVEENGVTYHHPQIIGEKAYLHQLEKQNLCAKNNITLYRLSSMDLRFPDRVIDEIYSFFKESSQFKEPGIELRRNFTLWDHQKEYITHLKHIREEKKENVSALVVLPTASGKSQIVIEDIYRYKGEQKGAKVLVVGPTINIANKWKKEFKTYALEVDTGTYHMLYQAYREKESDYYDYICIDEAHHAVAPMTYQALSYLTPKVLIGLTATPDRPDLKRLETLFGSYKTPLSITQAIEKKIISNIRVFRIETNVDLSEVRFNGKEYHNADLERTIRVPSRDNIIASLLSTYFRDKSMKGVIFCVNINHADEMAHTLNNWGLKAASVSSKNKDSQKVIEDFHNGTYSFICSCNMLNEGWDEKEVSILVMARPTMSKVLYLQQLGRGLRRTETKSETFVIDVVDTYGSLATPWSSHSIFQNNCYIPFGDITHRYKVGESLIVFGVEEKIQSITEVDIMTFEEKYPDYLSLEQCARTLFINTGTLLTWVKKGICKADLIIPFGNKSLYYFSVETTEAIRLERGLKEHNEETIKEDFFAFLEEKNYTYSFKMVFLKSFFTLLNQNGEARMEEVLTLYIDFYKNRIEKNLIVDRKSVVYTKEYISDTSLMRKSMLTNPFEKFERKRFLYYGKDVALLALHPNLFKKLTPEDIDRVISMMESHLVQYYEQLEENNGQ
ncbi:MAG: DEAD/DEAH box helicase [Spirochaetia bacterium]|nr:DEAD/DEAH box helicase [Spirochaetia bacterium]